MAKSFVKRVYWRLLRFVGLKRKAWDSQFKEGVWCRGPRSPRTVALVAELCRGGKLLEFGCGEGDLPHLLPEGTYSDYLGVDVSAVAIRTAAEKCAQCGKLNCQFQVGDMGRWSGLVSPVSLILLEECLYYLSLYQTEQFLSRCCSSLTRDGAILVIVHSATKHTKTLDVCRRVCHVLDEKAIGTRLFLTLTPKSSVRVGEDSKMLRGTSTRPELRADLRDSNCV
jgi:cyclopropane fatty-acyl-phospholipid synthase-like methyltransferase